MVAEEDLCGFRLEKGDGLDAGYLEAFAAADVFAADEVVATHHVALGFGEACAVAVVGSSGQLIFFPADDPAELVLGLLAAVRAGHRVRALLGPLVEKITFFHFLHLAGLRLVLRIPCRSGGGTEPHEEEYCIIAEGFAAVLWLCPEARMSRVKKKIFSKVTAAKSNARDRVGTPPPERVLPDPKQKLAVKPKHKETLADLINKTGEEV
ncbi:hypothetical protein [Edaphobacter aggregans]|uniref:hypothetical protein n=1 Tax=Edaphobacter aggregans TaxID=570835 RepID=UPI001FDFA45C|nr:hypothetical protein [Edaphobacter aggregans]